MTEQLAVDDICRNCLAVDSDQRALGAQARGVDGVGEGFLAGAGLADDQDRQAIARGLGGDRQSGSEIGRGADQLLERQLRQQLLGHRGEFAGSLAAVGIGGKRFEQTLGDHRAGEEIGCSGAHRLDCHGDRFAVGDDDHRQLFAACAEQGDQLRAASPDPNCQAAPPGLRGRADPAALLTAASTAGSADDAPAGAPGDGGDERFSPASASSSNSERVRLSMIRSGFMPAVMAYKE